jgi:ATP-dependent DNA helicase RecG
MALTPYHAKYFAYELTRRYSSDSLQKLAASLSDAEVDLNPHQVEAALFAFRSPLSKGAILADEVGLGKTIEAGIVISQKCAERNGGFFDTEMEKLDKWADDVKSSIEIELKELDREIKARKTEAKKILNLEEKVKAQRQIKEMEKKRNELRQNLYQAQDEVDVRKENLINEIVHRDYRIKGTSIYVRIYDDRVEIENPGGLPDGITRQDFGKSSVRRNPIIADLFHRMGKVERMGSGIERMRDLMREAGLKEPVFEMDAFFRVTFYRDPRYSLKADRLQKAGKKDGEAGEKIRRKYGEKGAEDTTQKITQKRLVEGLAEKLVEKLVESQQRILELTKENPYISKKKLSEIIGISTSAIDKNIQQLKKKGLFNRIGPDKGGHWEIVNG